jgi:amidohydrolase
MGILPGHESLVGLRRKLHKYPELSGAEEMTSLRISSFLERLRPEEILRGLGGHGLACRFIGNMPGPRVMVRAELDALPIDETGNFHYRSTVSGISHKCGHDGHMAIVAGVAENFSVTRPGRGELVVMFQPAEETGEGALKVINDPLFASMEPDYIIALHNLPGFKTGEIILRRQVFSAASKGMVVELKGRTSHASQPECGISPSLAVSEILRELPLLADSVDLRNFALVTVIHARIGEVAFGTSPGEAVIMATLRTFDEYDMGELTLRAESIVREIARSFQLEITIKWTQEFPATLNDDALTRVVENTAVNLGFNMNYIQDPFRWSEDFGWFTRRYRGVLFGLGAGKDHPALHSPDYDFPDEIIGTGVRMLSSVCLELFKEN